MRLSMSDENPCQRHRLAGERRVCAHIAALVQARAPANFAAKVEVALGELPLGGKPIAHLHCRECAEALRLPAVLRVDSEEETAAPAFDALVKVCVSCLDELLEAAEARR